MASKVALQLADVRILGADFVVHCRGGVFYQLSGEQ